MKIEGMDINVGENSQAVERWQVEGKIPQPTTHSTVELNSLRTDDEVLYKDGVHREAARRVIDASELSPPSS